MWSEGESAIIKRDLLGILIYLDLEYQKNFI